MSAILLTDLQELLSCLEDLSPTRLSGDLAEAQLCVFPYHILLVYPDGSTDHLSTDPNGGITLNDTEALQ